MRDFEWRWRSGRVRKHLFVRAWWFRNPLAGLWRWLRCRGWESERPEFECRGRDGMNGECYCPEGRETAFRIAAFGVGLWGSLYRDWTPRPCHCDKITWLLFPDSHADEIAEYGEERLRAEYPGVEAITFP